MSLNLKNTVCKPDDLISELKEKILELIQIKKITCNNLPTIDFSIPSIPSINPKQAVIELLMDVISLLNSINFDQMRMQLIDWLVEQTRPLEKNLTLNIKLGLKECYACKISPLMPDWLLESGEGINIEISKIDLECLFGVNPNSDVGKLRYDGNSSNDLNVFLWDVIQANGSPLLWEDPVTGQEIAYFTYLENDSTAFTEGGVPQTTNAKPEVIKMQIPNSYQDKSVITFINDYINSLTPLFDADKVIPNVINLIFGTLTKELDLSDQCVVQQVEFEEAISDYINVGLNEPEVTIDDSFYQFTPEQITNIKSKAKGINNGGIEFQTCCKKQTSSVSANTLKTLNDNLNNAGGVISEKIELLSNAMNDLQEQASAGVDEIEKTAADGEFWYNFIKSLQIALTKLVLSPKNLILFNTMFYLVNKESLPNEEGIKGFLKNLECILGEILKEIIRKIIYEYLLPMAINALKQIILCYVAKKLKEKGINYRLSLESLLPGGLVDALDEVNQLLGKAGDIVGDAQGFSDRLNLNSLNNINLQKGKRGRFCD